MIENPVVCGSAGGLMKAKSFYLNLWQILPYSTTSQITSISKRDEIRYCFIKESINEVKSISNNKEIRILDIGCGDMKFISKFKIKKIDNVKIFGLDISQAAVKNAKKQGINAYVLDVSEEKFPFSSDFFDISYMGDVLEHLFDPDFTILEIKRVLKPGGYLIVSTPNLACWYNRLLLAFGVQPIFSEVSTQKIFGRPGISKPCGHLRLFTLKSLIEFLEYYGFEVIKIKGTGFIKSPKIIPIIDTFLTRIPSLSPLLVLVAKVKK